MKKIKTLLTLFLVITFSVSFSIVAQAVSYNLPDENVSFSADYNSENITFKVVNRSEQQIVMAKALIVLCNENDEELLDYLVNASVENIAGNESGIITISLPTDDFSYIRVYPYKIVFENETIWGFIEERDPTLPEVKNVGAGFRVDNSTSNNKNGDNSSAFGFIVFALILLFLGALVAAIVALVVRISFKAKERLSGGKKLPDDVIVKRANIVKYELCHSDLIVQNLIVEWLDGLNTSINVNEVILKFCTESCYIETESELNTFFSKKYYKNAIKFFLYDYVNKMRNSLSSTLPLNKRADAGVFLKSDIDVLANNLPIYVDNLLERSFVKNTNAKDEISGFVSSLASPYKEYMFNLAYILTVATCVARLCFIQRTVYKLNKENELYRIIENLSKQFDDYNEVLEKSMPIYRQFYVSDLGGITNNLNYYAALGILRNRIAGTELSERESEIVNATNAYAINFNQLSLAISEWFNIIGKKYQNLEIRKYILFKYRNVIRDNPNLLLDGLKETKAFERLYRDIVEKNKRENARERYLNNDFSAEKVQHANQYNLDIIETGTQFEMLLVNLFSDLGYSVKHTGKAGDQGADLLVIRDNYIYAIQAKYYASKLGNTPIQEIVGSLSFYNAHRGVVVTNSSFTANAIKLAKANDVILIDGEKLNELIECAVSGNKEKDILRDLS